MSELEETANLENEAINAMTELLTAYGYSKADLDDLVATAVDNA